MTVTVSPDPSGSVQGATLGETYDEVYRSSWEAALSRCEQQFEKSDHERALKVKSASDFLQALRQLRIEHTDDNSQQIISLLFPALPHYEVFAESFVSLMAHSVDISMMWGLLFLIIKLSLESEGTAERIQTMLISISEQLEILNEILITVTDKGKFKHQVGDINREIFFLWIKIIMIFRTQELTDDPSTLDQLNTKFERAFDAAKKKVDGLIQHVQTLALVTGRQAVDLSKYAATLAVRDKGDTGRLPCHTIPRARNLHFYGRDDSLRAIDHYFQSPQAKSGMASLAIYGLGGIGKSQLAMEYAWKKQSELDAVFWIAAETKISILQGLSHVAVDALKLSGAEAGSHEQNSILVMEWLSKTESQWLLIYDNVELPLIFETYWPVSNHGSVLITTRKLTLAGQPVNKRIELLQFSPDAGAKFLVHSTQDRIITEQDVQYPSAKKVSIKLSGHALALSQMAALIVARGYSFDRFLVMYDKHSKRMHREHRTGWKYPGYKHAIDTVWAMSFENLNADEANCLSIVSLLVPDHIPLQLFEGSEKSLAFPVLKFCEDEYSREEIFERLASLALIRINAQSETITVHRLVQAEFLYQMKAEDRQKSFDAAVLLLLDKFPDRGGSKVDERTWEQAELYLPQVLILLDNFRQSQTQEEPLESSLNLLELICDTMWFLATNDSAGNRDFVLQTAFTAWDKFDAKDDAPLIHAYILGRSSDQLSWLGQFIKAAENGREALRIALKFSAPDGLEVNRYNVIAGIAYGSSEDYERAANHLSRAESTYINDPERFGTAHGILIYADIARNSYCNGEFDDARERLGIALRMAREIGSLYWEALLHFAYTSLGLRSKDLDLADEHIMLAANAIEKFGANRNIQLNGMFNYLKGRVRLKQARVEECIALFQTAVDIDAVQLTPAGYRARHLYGLARGQAALPRMLEASKQTLREAIRTAENPQLDVNNASWKVFDALIRIVER